MWSVIWATERSLEGFLLEGWEPFAAYYDQGDLASYIMLRKFTEAEGRHAWRGGDKESDKQE